jgi:hypothetical protein
MYYNVLGERIIYFNFVDIENPLFVIQHTNLYIIHQLCLDLTFFPLLFFIYLNHFHVQERFDTHTHTYIRPLHSMYVP